MKAIILVLALLSGCWVAANVDPVYIRVPVRCFSKNPPRRPGELVQVDIELDRWQTFALLWGYVRALELWNVDVWNACSSPERIPKDVKLAPL